jgi:blocked early in transport 1
MQNEVFSSMTTSVKTSAVRLGRMARSGDKIAVLKLAGIISAVVILLWWIWGLFAK